MSKRLPNDKQLPMKGEAAAGPLSKKSKVSSNDTDTDDELAKAKSKRPVGPMDVFMKNHKDQSAERINFVEENAPEYSPDNRPMGVLAAVVKVKETRKMMDNASSVEDFANAQKYKDEYESYFATGKKETHLYHNCTWLVDYATAKMNRYVTAQKFDKADQWKQRRDMARAYLTLVPENDIGCLFDKLTTKGAAVAFDPFADTTAEKQTDRAVAGAASTAAATSVDEDNDVINVDEVDDEDCDMINIEDDEDNDEEAESADTEAADGGDATAPQPAAARATKAKSKNSRERKSKKYTPVSTTTTTAVVNTTKQPKGKPPSDAAYYNFINLPSFNVHRTNKPSRAIVPKNQGYTLASHYLYCTVCKKRIDWGNRGPHAITGIHERALAAHIAMQADLENGRKKCQKRIDEEGLVGSTYSKEKIDAQLLWLQVACRGNWSLKSVEDNRVRSCLYVTLPFMKYVVVDMIN